ncbi:unnamed protein product [Schistosoma turkestanicum]|nr:unnamed protein product [Schistosoma turkestanicum]
MNDILKFKENSNNGLDILVDVGDDEELSSLIQCFPKESNQFIMKLRNSQYNKSTDAQYSLNSQPKQNGKKQPHRYVTNFDVEAPFSTSTTYRNTFCHQTDNNTGEKKSEPHKSLTSQPILRFGEMPVFTDSILYPGQNRRLQSTTHETFVEKPIPSISKPRVSQPFFGETQFHADFPPNRAWNSFDQLCSVAQHKCQPPKAQIQLRDTNEISFHTEQRDQFQGHDARTNPKPKSFKLQPSVYCKPVIKLDCNSVTKLDFQPYTVEQVLSVNSKSAFGSKTIRTDDSDVQQSGKMKPEELKLLKNYLKDLKSARNEEIPKI